MVSGLAAEATDLRPCRLSRLPITAKVERSGSVNKRREGRWARRILFSASRYSFCSRAADSPFRSHTPIGAPFVLCAWEEAHHTSVLFSTFEFFDLTGFKKSAREASAAEQDALPF